MLQYESLPLSHTLSVNADEKRLDLLLALHQFPFSFTFCSRRQSLSVLSSQQFFLRSMTYVVYTLCSGDAPDVFTWTADGSTCTVTL